MEEGTRTAPGRPRLSRRLRIVLGAALTAALAAAVVLLVAGGGSSGSAQKRAAAPEPVLTTAKPRKEPGKFNLRSHPQVVQVEGAGSQPKAKPSTADNGPSPGAPSDAQVRAELKQGQRQLKSFKQYLASSTAFLPTGPRARVLSDGSAVAPDNAPDVIKQVILAGNQIAKFPYKWGGGHGAWRDNGYDCSGSVSFALAGAGLLKAPLASGGFLNYGDPGPGKWITIYTNPGHIFMFVAGLRFDTSGRGRAGTRWQVGTRGTAGFAVRHVPGL
jgi:cell wall-associated NlpC family hydrolase